ncbi:hypothetical protein EDB92DRAFT_839264 [Lactarius akahatsu]|uniref:Uncharacterized protein n=1 Tax=Lactarius akahatsu TaxID=416441 RepID=A0AAD4LFI4_9AGAM|nr:hypothetical protein EDB92DRAFT_839264 [Lactarius akahatsu]
MPIFRHDSPYYAPLSSPAWLLINRAVFAVVQSLRWFDDLIDCLDFTLRDRVIDLGRLSLSRAVEGMGQTAEKTALEISSKIDARALKWTFDSLDEDNELERFFAGIPGFCISNVVSNPRALFIRPNRRGLSEALIALIQRTLTSNLINQSGRRRRTRICTDAMHTATLRIDPSICQRIFDGEWDGLLKFVEFGHFIRRDHYNDPYQAYYSTCMVAAVIARAKKVMTVGPNSLLAILVYQHLSSRTILPMGIVHCSPISIAFFGTLFASISSTLTSKILTPCGRPLNSFPNLTFEILFPSYSADSATYGTRSLSRHGTPQILPHALLS